VSQSNPDIVYVGTGESPIRGNVSHGDGIFKSTDAGKTWAYVGLAESRQIGRVRIHPKNPDIVYVSALGHVYGPNPERGVFRTNDGGKTWKKILFRGDSAGAFDLSLDPSDPETIYATIWHAYRTPWKLVSGGTQSGIFKSTDGGEHWTDITRNAGLPAGVIGKVGIAASPAKAGRVWALVEADSGGVFPLRRRWCNMDSHKLRSQSQAARVVLHADLRRPQRRRDGLCPQHGNVPLHERRKDLSPDPGSARRQSRLVDRAK
jgi:photosystem II stability/assembly factor-like uncharacterized protein